MAIREEVSGIGKDAKRTDLNVSQQPTRYISGMEYGQGQETLNQQLGAPMAGAVPMPAMPEIVQLGAPTQFPDEPISSGASWGAGPGLSSVVAQPPSLLSAVEKALQTDDSGVAEFLYNRLNR
jgi:hypothetical protein